MFDNYYDSNSSNNTHSHTHTHTEKRAPTDESIKLYNEMMEKAYKQVNSTIKINNNELSTSATVYRMCDFYNTSNNYSVAYAFILNGNKHEGVFTVERDDSAMRDDPNDILRGIAKKISEKVSYDILVDLIRYSNEHTVIY